MFNTFLLNYWDSNSATLVVRWYNYKIAKQPSAIKRWEAMIESWKRLFQTIGKKEGVNSWKNECILHNSLVKAERITQSDCANGEILETLTSTRDSSRKLQNSRIQGARIRARINCLEHGDKGSKYLFRLLKSKEARDTIEVICGEGRELNDHKEILNAFAKFYAKLFTLEDQGTREEEERNKIKSLIPVNVSMEDRVKPDQSISKEEIVNAIAQMNNDKALGPDGILVEFYKTRVDLARPHGVI